jgi:hypothetical protein
MGTRRVFSMRCHPPAIRRPTKPTTVGARAERVHPFAHQVMPPSLRRIPECFQQSATANRQPAVATSTSSQRSGRRRAERVLTVAQSSFQIRKRLEAWLFELGDPALVDRPAPAGIGQGFEQHVGVAGSAIFYLRGEKKCKRGSEIK